MKSTVAKRSVKIAGHTTSVSLEDAFWTALKEIASGRDMTLAELVTSIHARREHGNLSSAIRLFVLDHFHIQFTEETSVTTGARHALPNLETARPAKSA
jgi:predicted DNA-binding ribbon-helix-helix protein